MHRYDSPLINLISLKVEQCSSNFIEYKKNIKIFIRYSNVFSLYEFIEAMLFNYKLSKKICKKEIIRSKISDERFLK